MNPEPNLEQPPPVLTDLPSAAMASPSPSSTSSSSSTTSSKNSKGSLKKEEEEESPPVRAADDLSTTPQLIGKAGPPTTTVPPAVAAAVSSYVLPKARKVRRSGKRKGDDGSNKPRRPLSAYNYFFKENRAMLLAERDEKLKKAKENGEGTEGIESGYGFFGTMAKVIAQRWKEVSQDSLEVYKKKAEIDSKRYREEMDEYNTRKRLAPKPVDASKKGKKSKIKALKKEKGAKGVDMAAAKYGMAPTAADDPRALAGLYAAPQDYVLQAQQMARFAPQQMNSGLDFGLGGAGGGGGGGGGMGVLPRSAMSMAATNQLMGMGQADLEAQLALLQQQRQLEAMGLFTQATRPALLGIPSQQLGYSMMGGGGTGGIQQQYMLEQMGGVPGTMSLLGAAPAPMNDLSFSSRMDTYAAQQQQEQDAAFLRQQQQQMLMGPVSAQQDPAYANLLLQLRLQEQEDRLRNQAALGMGQGRW